MQQTSADNTYSFRQQKHIRQSKQTDSRVTRGYRKWKVRHIRLLAALLTTTIIRMSDVSLVLAFASSQDILGLTGNGTADDRDVLFVCF